MLRTVNYTYIFHICNMFDEVPEMASRGPVKVLNKYFV